MFKRGGHMPRRQGSSSSSSPSLSSSPVPASNPQPQYGPSQYGHVGPSSHPQQYVTGLGHMPTERSPVQSPLAPSPSVPPHYSAEQSNIDGNRGQEDNRFFICPFGDSFTDATTVVRELNKIVRNFWMGEYMNYRSVPQEVKEMWWNEFKRKFKWEETENNEVRRIFDKKISDFMRNVMNRAKGKQAKPSFFTADNWVAMNTFWASEQSRQLCEQNKKNRSSSSSEGSATYAGGSINIAEHRKRLAHELGTEPTFTATFERTFQKKDKTWTGDRARAVKERYDDLLLSSASGSDDCPEPRPPGDDMALWMEAAGGPKKGKIFGLGSLSRMFMPNSPGSSSSAGTGRRKSRKEEQLTQEVGRLTNLLVKKDERIDSLEDQMRLVMEHLNLQRNAGPPVPPANPMGHGHIDAENADVGADADDDDDDDDDFLQSP